MSWEIQTPGSSVWRSYKVPLPAPNRSLQQSFRLYNEGLTLKSRTSSPIASLTAEKALRRGKELESVFTQRGIPTILLIPSPYEPSARLYSSIVKIGKGRSCWQRWARLNETRRQRRKTTQLAGGKKVPLLSQAPPGQLYPQFIHELKASKHSRPPLTSSFRKQLFLMKA